MKFFKSVQKKSLEIIEKESFDGIILIDYPGFNLRLAKKIKEKNPQTPIHYYISPQIWAWKEERLKIIKDYVDQMIVIPHGTGSKGKNSTMLSYDVSGNYFDLDLSLLEPGYTYGLRFSFYEDSVSSYRQQPYLFKIRVEKDEY